MFELSGFEAEKGFIWNVQRYNVHDGAGIRIVVFFKGCPLRCAWCSNPEGKSGGAELRRNPDKCIGCRSCVQVCPSRAISFEDRRVQVDRAACGVCGACAEACPSGALELLGTWMTAQELLEEINKDVVFFRRSGGGVTLSGGEVMLQADFAARLLQEVKDEGLDTAIETCGAVGWPEFEKVLPYVNTFLYDLKLMDEKMHKNYTGLSNIGILGNAEKLAEHGANLVFRMPVIPGFNDSEENIGESAKFARRCNALYLELLPYHELGASKYGTLGMSCEMKGASPPTAEQMERYSAYAKQYFERIVAGKQAAGPLA